MADLLALTLLRPWEQSILHLDKDVENRKWKPSERVRGQRIALHAGLGWDDEGAGFILDQAPPGVRQDWALTLHGSERTKGHIVGTVRVVDWFHFNRPRLPKDQGKPLSIWAFGPWCWMLEDVFELPEPVACKGALSLWRVPPDVAARVLEQEAARGR